MLQEAARVFTRHAEPCGAHEAFARQLPGDARDPHAPALPAEFAALERAGVTPGPLYAALAEATRQNVAPFDALATSGAIAEAALVETLARALGVDLLAPGDPTSPIDAETFEAAMRTGHLWGRDADGAPRLVVAARGTAVGRLALSRRGKPFDRRVALASPRAFADFAVASAGSALAERAAEGPTALHPELSVAALPAVGLPLRLALVGLALAAIASAFLVDAVGVAMLAACGLLFAVLNAFRLWLTVTPPTDAYRMRRIPDADLPVYTVMVALFREGAVVPGLIDALERLDYPRAKLDIKILTEEGDHETLSAIADRAPRSGIEVIVMPKGEPQTKPRALNAGLLAARGEFLTVFDAEDRPDPDQLRIAIEAFRRGRDSLACVQAKLAIDNLGDGWLVRHFAIEYAALFDVVLPALSTLGLPIALGGTSNHFRVSALKSVGGWDAGNVTEDADLGLRLARLGWTTETIASTTWEEAPTKLWPWIKQRTRWMKGFMVTAVVHGRRPGGLARSLGPLSFTASQLLIGGVALTALAYPLVVVAILWNGLSGTWLAEATSAADATLAGFHVANMIVGFSAGLACGWMGVDRRCPPHLALDLFTLPFYWMLVGFAAWRALYQLALAQTTHWEKTTHGVSNRRRAQTYM